MPAFVSEATIQVTFPERLLAEICGHLAEHEREVHHLPDLGTIKFGAGQVEMRAAEQGLGVRIEAASPDALASARSFVADHLEEFSRGEPYALVWTGYGAGETALHNFRVTRVLRTAMVTPHMRRITLTGKDLDRFASGGLHCKLVIPPAGLAEPEWPRMGLDGRPAWPPAERRPAVRIYTIRRIDVTAGELDTDFVLHGDGGIGSWSDSPRRLAAWR